MEDKTKSTLLKIVVFAVELILGVILLINPVGVTRAIIISAGIISLIYALINIINYFKLDPVTASLRQCMFKGLAAAVFGGFCVCRSQWFIATFPVFTIIYGIGILTTGLFKVQTMTDLIRFKQKWWLVCFSAVISILFSGIILANPFASTAALWMFVGISLVAAAVIDIISLIADVIWETKNKSEDKQ